MNFIQIVGRIVTPPFREVKIGNESYSQMIVEVQQNFKAFEGSVRKDSFKVSLWRGMSDHILQACSQPGLVAIKGRVMVIEGEYSIIAEHVEVLNP